MNHILFIPEKLVLRDSAQSFPQAVCAPKVFFKRMTHRPFSAEMKKATD